MPTPYLVASGSGLVANPTLAVATPTAAGDAAFLSVNGGGAVTGVTDTQGNTYLAVFNDTSNGVSFWAATYKGSPGTPTAALATTDHFTVATGSGGNAVLATGCAGLAAQAANVNTGTATAGTSTAASQAITPLNVGDLLIQCWMFGGNAVSAAHVNGFTKIADVSINSNGGTQGYLTATGTVSVTAQVNWGASIGWHGGVASFRAATGAATWVLVQSSPLVSQTAAGTLAPTFAAPTTAGNLLILKTLLGGSVTLPTAPSPAFTARVNANLSSPVLARADIWDLVNTAGGITACSITCGNAAAAIVEEWTTSAGPPGASVGLPDKTGTLATGTPTTAPSIPTSAALTANDELATSALVYRLVTSATETLTTGANFTQQAAWNNGATGATHGIFDRRADTGASSGSVQTDAITSSLSAAGTQCGVIACYILPAAATAAILPQQTHRRFPALFTRITSRHSGAVYR